MTYFGKGIYTLTTAAKILKINPQKMRRWIKGYTHLKNMECRSYKPLFKTEFDYDPNDVGILVTVTQVCPITKWYIHSAFQK